MSGWFRQLRILNKKNLLLYRVRGFEEKRQRLTLPGFTPVPSALVGLTALFGMGRGDPHRYSHLKIFAPYRFTDRLISLTVLMKEFYKESVEASTKVSYSIIVVPQCINTCGIF